MFATFMVSIDLSLLYLIGNPENPVTVWTKSSDQFAKKTCANKLELHNVTYQAKYCLLSSEEQEFIVMKKNK